MGGSKEISKEEERGNGGLSGQECVIETKLFLSFNDYLSPYAHVMVLFVFLPHHMCVSYTAFFV